MVSVGFPCTTGCSRLQEGSGIEKVSGWLEPSPSQDGRNVSLLLTDDVDVAPASISPLKLALEPCFLLGWFTHLLRFPDRWV